MEIRLPDLVRTLLSSWIFCLGARIFLEAFLEFLNSPHWFDLYFILTESPSSISQKNFENWFNYNTITYVVPSFLLAVASILMTYRNEWSAVIRDIFLFFPLVHLMKWKEIFCLMLKVLLWNQSLVFEHPTISIICTIVLSMHDPNFLVTLPVILYLSHNEVHQRRRKNENPEYMLFRFGFFIAIYLGIVYTVNYNQFTWPKAIIPSSSLTFTPRYGILWYIDALLMPEYETYFQILIFILPILAGSLITYQLMVDDAGYQLTIALLYGVNTLFSENFQIIDMILSLLLIAATSKDNYHYLLSQWLLRYLIPFIAITIILSPYMFYTWVYLGTGNANYLFFQGVVLWFAFAIWIIEFLRTKLRIELESI
jgi:hypothetical protein